VLKYYDKLPSFSQLTADFEQAQKPAVSRWQERRANLNHNVFQHEFYQMLTGVGRRPFDLMMVNAILEVWPNIKQQFAALFEEAVPFAVVDPRLSIAQFNPAAPASATTIEEFRQRYGEKIRLQIEDSKSLLQAVDSQVTAVRVNPDDQQNLDRLIAACRTFTDRVAELDALSVLARGN
jgi:hypothetical protein